MEEREDKGAPDRECVVEIRGTRALNESQMELNLGEILPIRFLHFYANRSLAVTAVPLFFAGNHAAVEQREAWGPEQALTAYHCQDGNLTALTKLEWDAVQRSVELANRVSRAKQKDQDEWLKALLQALPVAFVRREEFDAAYQSLLFPKEPAGYKVVTGENGELELETDFVDRTEERLSLNDSPYIPPGLRPVVFQGFVQETDGKVPQFLVDLCNGEGFEPFEDEGTGESPASAGDPGHGKGNTHVKEPKPRGVKGPRTPFSQALDRLYRYFHEKGETAIISKGPESMRLFLRRLAQCLKEPSKDDAETVELHEYISQRIEVVQPSEQVRTIKAEEEWGKYESRWYSYGNIRAELSRLRAKYPPET